VLTLNQYMRMKREFFSAFRLRLGRRQWIELKGKKLIRAAREICWLCISWRHPRSVGRCSWRSCRANRPRSECQIRVLFDLFGRPEAE